MTTSDATKEYSIPTTSTADRDSLEQMRRGLCQQADGLKKQLDGVRQQIRAVDAMRKQTGA